eukprot:2442848-Prymnesium_polylepis.1
MHLVSSVEAALSLQHVAYTPAGAPGRIITRTMTSRMRARASVTASSSASPSRQRSSSRSL